MASKSSDGEVLDLEKKESIGRKLVIAEFLFITSVMMVVPTRAPIVLGLKKGDVQGAARIIGLMSSSAAFIELWVNPVFGQLSDMNGRRPFFMIPPLTNAFMHSLVWLFPQYLWINFIDRAITGSMIFSFKAPLSAALSDLFQGPQLAAWLARQQAAFGLGLTCGSLLGGSIGGPRSFLGSTLMFLTTMVYAKVAIPETLAITDRKKEFVTAACSPLRFLKLFTTKKLSTLSVAVALQSFGDYLNLYDINFLFLKTVFNVGPTEIARYASSVGFTNFLSGFTMTRAIKELGQQKATLMANTLWATAMFLFGTAKGVPAILLSLVAMCFGHTRNSAIAAYIQKHGQAGGMGRSEIAAAQANLLAIIKVGIPVFYANIFVKATSNGRNIPGAPYMTCASLTILAQLCFWTIDPEKIDK